MIVFLSLMAGASSPLRAMDYPDSPLQDETEAVSWQMRGRVLIHNLQFGPAMLKEKEWVFIDKTRTFNASAFQDRLTLMIRFQYRGVNPDTPLKFIIKLPAARPYEETVRLPDREGTYTYRFTIHEPAAFLGSGSAYLYYGFNLVSVFDFTIMPGS